MWKSMTYEILVAGGQQCVLSLYVTALILVSVFTPAVLTDLAVPEVQRLSTRNLEAQLLPCGCT